MENNKNREQGKYSTGKSLFVDLTLHFTVTLSLACFFYFFTGRISWVILCITGGILIDIDHFIDHFLHYGRHFRLVDFLFHSYLDSGKIYVVFHSWEILILLWIISFRVSWFIPLAAGMTGHLMIDQLFSRKPKLFYFLAFRWYHGFSRDKTGVSAPEDR